MIFSDMVVVDVSADWTGGPELFLLTVYAAQRSTSPMTLIEWAHEQWTLDLQRPAESSCSLADCNAFAARSVGFIRGLTPLPKMTKPQHRNHKVHPKCP